MSSMSQGGAQRVTALLCNAWVERGDEVCLITLESAETDCYELDPRVRRMGLTLTADARGVLDAINRNRERILALRRTLLGFRPTAVLGFGDQTNVLTVLATRGTRLRCVIAEVTDPARHSIGTTWTILRRLAYPLADALVVQTQVLRRWGRQIMFSARKTHVVRNPVREMSRFRRRDGDAERRVVIAMGRLAPEKAFDVLLAAFARVAGEFEGWRLVILGEGPERDALTTLACSLGIGDRMALPGWMQEPGDALCNADLFVLSSRYEGFPNALLEAMACGLPVLATECIGAREIITHDTDGWLVPVDSVVDLAAAMRRLMSDELLRKRLGKAAMHVNARFSLSTLVRQWDEILVPVACGTA